MFIVHGAGRHGEVITSVLLDQGKVVKITDDSEGTSPGPSQPNIIAIGDNRARMEHDNEWLVTVQHPNASVSGSAQIQPGCFIGDGVLVNASAKIGRGCIINTGAIVEHDNQIGDWCHLSPGAVLCGCVVLGEGVWIGANATIKNNIVIRPWVVIGCGAVVVKDITEPGTYIGNPAKKLGD